MKKLVTSLAIWLMGSGCVLVCVPEWAARLGIIISFTLIINIVAWSLIALGFIAAGVSIYLNK